MDVKSAPVFRYVISNKWKIDAPVDQENLETSANIEMDESNGMSAGETDGKTHNASSHEEEDDDEEDFEQEEVDLNLAKKEINQYCFELLNEHCIQQRQGHKAFRCDVCDGTYRHAFSLKRHFLRTHVNYVYLSSSDISNCNINLSPQEETLRKEFIKRCQTSAVACEALPVKTDLFRCNTCTQLFDDLKELKYHIAHHPNSQTDRRFSCNQCNMTFSHKQNLVRHLSVHSGEKPYTCKHCGKGFPTATNQRRHERIHEGLKPYICTHCLSHFSQSGDLKKHIRKLHRDFFHPCAFCLKYFSTELELKVHCLSHGKTLELNYRALKKKVSSSNSTPSGNGNSSRPVSVADSIPQLENLNNSLNLQLVCSGCNRRFLSQVTLSRHKKLCDLMSEIQDSTNVSEPVENNIVSAPVSHNNNTSNSNGNGHFMPSKYYSTVSENIAANLQNHVDGKLYNSNKSQVSKFLQAGVHEYVNRSSTDWSMYNFPPDFSGLGMVSAVEKNRIYEFCADDVEEEMEYNSCSDHNSTSLESNTNRTGLSECQVLDLSVSYDKPSITKCQSIVPAEGKLSLMIYICHVCGERFQTLNDINEHKINNHPNVYCTHLELESSKDAPMELFQYHCSPVGILQKCQVLSSSTTTINPMQLRCTKCKELFAGTGELHEHILACGGISEDSKYSKKRVYVPPKGFKRGVKRRISCEIEIIAPKTRRSCAKRDPCLISEVKPTREINTYRCTHCDSVFKNISGYERHQKLCPEGTVPTRNEHRCYRCDQTFSYAASLKKHMMDVCFTIATKRKHKSSMMTSKKKLNKTRLAIRNRKVLAVKILKDKKIKLTRQVSILNPKMFEKISTVAITTTDSNAATNEAEVEKEVEAKMIVETVAEKKEEFRRAEVIEPEVILELKTEVDVKESIEASSEEAVPVPIVTEMEEPEFTLTNEKENIVLKGDPKDKSPEVEVTAEDEVLSAENAIEVLEEISTNEREIDFEMKKELIEVEGKVEEIEAKEEDAIISTHAESSVAAEVIDESNKELVVVKTESDILMSREQQHTCPNCKRTFTYLANFKKHLNHLCPLRETKKDETVTETRVVDISAVSSTENCEANKENSEEKVANSKKATSSETESEVSVQVRSKSSPQSCSICHKTFSSYLVMLKHRLSHKLRTSSTTHELDQNHEHVKEAVKKRSPVRVGSATWNRNGKRRRKKGIAGRLRGAKKIVANMKKIVKKVKIEEEDVDENEDLECSSSNGPENYNEDEIKKQSLSDCDDSNSAFEEKNSEKANNDESKDEEESENESKVTLKNTRSSKANSHMKSTGIKKAQISEYRKTILRKVNESLS